MKFDTIEDFKQFVSALERDFEEINENLETLHEGEITQEKDTEILISSAEAKLVEYQDDLKQLPEPNLRAVREQIDPLAEDVRYWLAEISQKEGLK